MDDVQPDPEANPRYRLGRRAVTLGAVAAAAGLVTARAASPASASPADRFRVAPAVGGPMGSGPFHFRTLENQADRTFNQLLGINDHGVIAGYFGSGGTGHPNRGYTVQPNYSQRSFVSENVPGSAQTQVIGINNAGATVGFWIRGDGANVGFVSSSGQFLSVTNPAGTATPTFDQLLGVINRGLTVGFYNDAAGNSHGYTYNPRTHHFSPVIVLGATSVVASGINDAGHISGFATLSGGSIVAFLTRGLWTSIAEVPGSVNTQALGVNNSDVVVGSYLDSTGKSHGFVAFDTGEVLTVDDPVGSKGTVINGLNNHGQIVGFFIDAAGNNDGFIGHQ